MSGDRAVVTVPLEHLCVLTRHNDLRRVRDQQGRIGARMTPPIPVPAGLGEVEKP